MTTTNLGLYIDKETGKHYMVDEHTNEASIRLIRSGRLETAKTVCYYRTACGIDLEPVGPVGDKLQQFSLMQIPGTITRVT